MSWYKDTLGSVSEKIQTGPFGSQLHQSDYRDEGVPVIMPKDMIEGRISILSIARISEEHVERLKQHKVKSGDIVYSRRGDVGKCALITDKEEDWLCGTGCLKVTLNPKKIIPKFAFYQLQRKESIGWLINHAVGSTMLNLNTSILTKLPIEITDLDNQQSIVNILASYDDLIENNQKQIQLLEEAAQRLYKEWFIDLRFPGHENVEIVDGVPRGWTRKTVLDCLETYIGGGWGKEDITSKNTIAGKVIRGTDINDIKSGIYTGIPLRYHTENDKKKRTLKTNDIVFELSNGNLDNIGRSLLIDELILNNCGENTICASFCKLFRPLDRVHSLLLYLEILDMNSRGRMLPYKKQGSNGINNFAFEEFLLHELLIPSDHKMVDFIDTIMSKIMVARNQIALLQEARDRLLPKLMNGEIEV